MEKEQILKIIQEVEALKKTEENTLPGNSYFMQDNSILCCQREKGDSRYPYTCDGLIVFAHTNGYIDACDGMFNIFRCANYNEDAVVNFFAGEKQGEEYLPVSITGADRMLYEDNVERFTVFTLHGAYYITKTQKAVFAAFVSVDDARHIRFSVCAYNRGEQREIYLASYFEPMLRYVEAEGFFDRMTKYGSHYDCGSFLMRSRNRTFDCLAINREISGNVTESCYTTAKSTFVGASGRNLTNAQALRLGRFTAQIPETNTSDIPIASDMVHFLLDTDGFASIDYDMLVCDDIEKAQEFIGRDVNSAEAYKRIIQSAEEEKKEYDNLKISFSKWDNSSLNSRVFEKFIKCVQKQVSLCALGKNYAGPFLGIRDVFQQLEGSLMWQREKSRAQIVRVMNYILEDGRAPRQISFPNEEKPVPDMDLRPYIDQGLWIIDTLHTYLTYTGDDSILDEVCTYYKAENTLGPVLTSERKDTVIEHLLAVCDYLISKLDPETGCLRALWGDWNDALDGLGRSADPKIEFGSGVSVMATAQLYGALEKMIDILKFRDAFSDKAELYKETRDTLAENYRKYAVCQNEEGKYRILHGWGDKRGYFVGSYKDYDSKSRISLTAHAFCAISGLTRRYPELCRDVADNIISLDSKYGLLTFDKPFEPFAAEVGRISTITPGTYENSASYVHAGTFGIMALFLLGRAREAWCELEKAMVITHDNPTLTTFVMPNSYCETEKYSIDGVSMGDWYTGSGTVLIKELVKFGFGILPSVDGLYITAPKYFPCEKGTIELKIRNSSVICTVFKSGEANRRIYLNGAPVESYRDEQMDTNCAFIASKDFTDIMNIEIK